MQEDNGCIFSFRVKKEQTVKGGSAAVALINKTSRGELSDAFISQFTPHTELLQEEMKFWYSDVSEHVIEQAWG